MAGKTNPRSINANVTDDAYNAWHDIAAEHGLTVSSLVEVLARDLPRIVNPDHITAAREVFVSRQRRRRDG